MFDFELWLCCFGILKHGGFHNPLTTKVLSWTAVCHDVPFSVATDELSLPVKSNEWLSPGLY